MSQSWPLAWLALLGMLVVVAAGLRWRAPSGDVRVARVAGSAVLFAALGPPLGGLLIGIPAALTVDDPEPWTMLLFVVAMSYVPGLVPALAGGACMGVLRPKLGPGARLGAAALLCALAAAAFGIGALDLPMASLPPMLGLGAVSGSILEAGWLVRERRRRDTGVAAGRSTGCGRAYGRKGRRALSADCPVGDDRDQDRTTTSPRQQQA